MEYLAIGLGLAATIVVSVLIGIFVGINRMKKAIEERSVGHLRIDRSEPDERPKAFLEIMGTTIDSISQKNYVVLKVINEDYLSRD